LIGRSCSPTTTQRCKMGCTGAKGVNR
jgi:hypothetical protein